MTVPPFVQGRCPGALRPMMSGDGLVVRIRPPGGHLPSDQAQAIAALSRRLGNGLIDVTSRANLQLRGVGITDHPALITTLRDMGLIDTDAVAESRRNVILSPFAPQGGTAWQIAARLAMLMTAPDAPRIPAKFGFAVATGAEFADTLCDIRLFQSGGQWRIAPDGTMASAPAGDDPARKAVALARWFIDTDGAPDGRGRMRRHLASGARPPLALTDTLVAPQRNRDPGPAPNGWLVGLPFGQITPEQIAALARCGDLRLTPWRALLVENLTRPPDLPGLILNPDDPLRRVHACTGAPGCLHAHAETRDIARRLARNLTPQTTLHVSGCAKGCAHRDRTNITLIATSRTRFDMVENGTPADPPARNIDISDIPA